MWVWWWVWVVWVVWVVVVVVVWLCGGGRSGWCGKVVRWCGGGGVVVVWCGGGCEGSLLVGWWGGLARLACAVHVHMVSNGVGCLRGSPCGCAFPVAGCRVPCVA